MLRTVQHYDYNVQLKCTYLESVMLEVNVTQLRNNLPAYLSSVEKGEEIIISSRGHIIAKITAPTDVRTEAKKQLKALRKNCKIGDVISPIGEAWEVEE